MCAKPEVVEPDLKSVCSVQNEGLQISAHATGNANVNELTGSGEDTIIKKRKTRRGKSKRRNPNPYTKLTWQQRKNMYNRPGGPYNRNKYNNRSNILNHALAPFNSNQFLMEDHGELQELDDKLNKSDGAGASTTNPPRTRDSSFSVDSDADFYSTPEDEEEFLTKEFDTAYENLQGERLQSMSKAELIEEYLQLESKVELLTKRLRGKSATITSVNNEMEDPAKSESSFQQEINKLLVENDELRRENEHLRSGMCRTASSFSSSMDSESDSSSSTCNSSSTSSNDDIMKEDLVEVVENGIDEDNICSPTPSPTNVRNGNENGENSPPVLDQEEPLNSPVREDNV